MGPSACEGSSCCHHFTLDNEGFHLQVCQLSTLPELGLSFSIKSNAYLSKLARQRGGGLAAASLSPSHMCLPFLTISTALQL